MILSCWHSGLSGDQEQCHNDITHVPTSLGVCTAFNAGAAPQIFNRGTEPSLYWDSLDRFYAAKRLGPLLRNGGASSNSNKGHDISLVLDMKSRFPKGKIQVTSRL